MENASQIVIQKKILRPIVQTINQTFILYFAQYPYTGVTGQQAIKNDFWRPA